MLIKIQYIYQAVFTKMEELDWTLLVEQGYAKAPRQVILSKFKE